ncbi:MarR family winged helix-turn-helix transcriptional regulator [Desulfopila aestuarii]|uniref:MarR family transcriptional regulator, 2-MHQ and catechol-resistance regulon repressor n=1 Tax=Desulfopila aestuarii DSM 18488 TaxID=1121416 RepID=A0A1M7YLM2_9BACT|nr:MarR family transcriptional regulator [Desulfopila aestuarii]SHO53479.1 MarR family transcriptional regulator, 2-MHQ and catechol-resistance regulon repressor [Desulfopila aestuarii DSM 18488]
MKYSQLPDKQRNALNLFVKLMRATNKLTSTVHEHLKDDNLTISQFGVLEAVYHLGPLSQSELGNKILKSNANLTTVVDSLEKKMLVERERASDDRRRVTVKLTESGKELISQVFPRHAQVVTNELAFLSDQDKDTLEKLLRKFK